MFHNKEFITTEVEIAKAKIAEVQRTAKAKIAEVQRTAEAKRIAEAEFVEAKMAAKDEIAKAKMAVEAEFKLAKTKIAEETKLAKTKMIAEAKAKMAAEFDLTSNGIYPLNELKKISSEGASSFDDNSSHLLGNGSEEHHTE
ncbi:hypothetical protein [Candidatus Tisiphia endosymbiont of Ceraclea dissimilis]|uniref:hypothetical protein n=1 Tax=Candidatus Tisiphia endosymbiont of Ceraclea dissimilis TaxID=3077928 RepID=UPI003CCB0E23